MRIGSSPLTLSLLSAAVCAALGCSHDRGQDTAPPPGQTHATNVGGSGQSPALDNGPAPGPRQETGTSAEETMAEAKGAEAERQPVAGRESPDRMTDENILAALITSNQMEVKMADMVAGKTKDAEVKQFARMLSKDHSATLKKLDAIRDKLAIQPVEDVGVRQMKDEGEQKLTSLAGMKGKELDIAFLDTAIDRHQKTLAKIDDSLLPNVKAEDLRALIAELRPVVQMHLDDANKIRDKPKK